MHPQIKDRFDLTLECIRRHYVGQANPLGNALAVYARVSSVFLGTSPGTSIIFC